MIDIIFLVLLGCMVFFGIVCPLLFLIYDLFDLGDKFSDGWSKLKLKMEELSEKWKVKSAKRPFAAQMRKSRFSYNFDKEENAYVMFCDGQPLRWKKFEPVKKTLYGCYDEYRAVEFNGTDANNCSWKSVSVAVENFYKKENHGRLNTPFYMKGLRFACDEEEFLFNENTYDVGLGNEEEASKMLRILNMGCRFLTALKVNHKRPIYPSICKKSNTDVWEAGVVVETDCGRGCIRFQFIPLNFLTETELDDIWNYVRHEEPRKKIITSRGVIDI